MAALSGCQKHRPPPDQIVARVENEFLTRNMIEQLLPADIPESDREFYAKKLINKWIEEEILSRTARKDGIVLSPVKEWQIKSLRREFIGDQLLKEKLTRKYRVSDAEIEAYYQKYPELFTRAFDEVHLVHLYLEKLDRAITREIRGSKSLLEIIKKNYLDRQITPNREPNGDLGYVPVEQLRKIFARAIRGRRTGRIYGPIKTAEGYHYLQVLDRKPAGSIRSLKLVRDEIITRIKAEKKYQAEENYVKELKKNFNVETFPENLR